jgi:hypothetical protein
METIDDPDSQPESVYNTQPVSDLECDFYEEIKNTLGGKDKDQFLNSLLETYKNDNNGIANTREALYDYAKGTKSNFPPGGLRKRVNRRGLKTTVAQKLASDIYDLYSFIEGNYSPAELAHRVLSAINLDNVNAGTPGDSVDGDAVALSPEEAAEFVSQALELKHMMKSSTDRVTDLQNGLDTISKTVLKIAEHLEKENKRLCAVLEEKNKTIANLKGRLNTTQAEKDDKIVQLMSEITVVRDREAAMYAEIKILKQNYKRADSDDDIVGRVKSFVQGETRDILTSVRSNVRSEINRVICHLEKVFEVPIHGVVRNDSKRSQPRRRVESEPDPGRNVQAKDLVLLEVENRRKSDVSGIPVSTRVIDEVIKRTVEASREELLETVRVHGLDDMPEITRDWCITRCLFFCSESLKYREEIQRQDDPEYVKEKIVDTILGISEKLHADALSAATETADRQHESKETHHHEKETRLHIATPLINDNNRQGQKIPVIGEGKSEDGFCSVIARRPKSKAIVLSRVSAHIEFKKALPLIVNHERSNDVKVTYIRLLKVYGNDTESKSFTLKVNVSEMDYEKAFQSTTWPSGVWVRPCYQNIRRGSRQE